MPESLGEAVLELSTDHSGLDSGISSAKSKAQKLGSSLESLGKSLSTKLTLPILAMGTGVLLASANFEQGMNRLSAVAQPTAEQFQNLSNLAKELGSTTKFSASQAAEGMGFLGQAGFKANEIVSAMPGLLDLAAAGQLELGRAADIATNILSGFGEASSETGRVADVIAKAASSANTSVEQMGSAMSFVAPQAKDLNISIEETAAFIGKLSDAGLQGERAGTGLRGVISSLIKPSGEAASALKAMGVSTFDASGKMRPLIDIMGDMGRAGADSTALVTIFGREAASAASILKGVVLDGSLQELTTQLEDSGGAAKTMADIMQEGLSGAWVTMKSALEGLAIAVGESGLVEFITEMVKTGTEWIRNASELNPTLLAVGTTIAAFAAAAGPAILIVGQLVSSFGTVSPAIAFLTGPIGWLIGAVVLLTAGYVAFNEEITQFVAGVSAWFGEIVAGSPILQMFLDSMSGGLDILIAVGGALIDLTLFALTPLIEGFTWLGEKVSEVFGFFQEKGKAAIEANNAAMVAAEEVTKGAAEGMGDLLDEALGASTAVESFTVATKAATVATKATKIETFNLETAMKKADTGAVKFSKTLEKMKLKKATDRTEDLIDEMIDLAKQMPVTGDAGLDAMELITGSAEDTLAELAKFDGMTQDMATAFETFGIETDADLTATRIAMEAQFNLIKNSGIASAGSLGTAWSQVLQARIDELNAKGPLMTAAERATLNDMKAEIGTFSTDTIGPSGVFTKWFDGVKGLVDGMGAILVKGIFSGGFDKEKLGTKLKALADSFKDKLFDVVDGFIDDFITKSLSKVFTSLDSLSDKLASVLGIGTSAGTSVAGGATSTGGGAAGGATGVAGGLGQTVSIISGVVSAISGVISNFQLAGMNEEIKQITHWTKLSAISLGGSAATGEGGLSIRDAMFKVSDNTDFITPSMDTLKDQGWTLGGLVQDIKLSSGRVEGLLSQLIEKEVNVTVDIVNEIAMESA